MKTKDLFQQCVKSSNGKRGNKRYKSIEDEDDRKGRKCLPRKRISDGPKGIVAIIASIMQLE
ncbi:hypothetical protein NXW91_17755 [Bacteroides fragilis]|nr:hypothetical protein [Bacteroides fragilis]